MKRRPDIPSRKSDDVMSMMAEAGELRDPSAYDIVFKQCETEFKKQRKPWRKFCGHRTVFNQKDEDGYFSRLYAAQQDYDTKAVLAERKAADLKKHAEVHVRRQKMLERNRQLRERNLVMDQKIKAGDARFRVSPSKQYADDLDADGLHFAAASVVHPGQKKKKINAQEPPIHLRNLSKSSAGLTASFGNLCDEFPAQVPSRPSSIASRHTSDHAQREKREATPPYFSLDFDLDVTQYHDNDEVKATESLACTQTPDTVNPDMYRSAWLRSLRTKHSNTKQQTFSVASSEGVVPTSIGDRLRTFKVPHTARKPNVPLVERWQTQRQQHGGDELRHQAAASTFRRSQHH